MGNKEALGETKGLNGILESMGGAGRGEGRHKISSRPLDDSTRTSNEMRTDSVELLVELHHHLQLARSVLGVPSVGGIGRHDGQERCVLIDFDWNAKKGVEGDEVSDAIR